eukprot:1897367-Alexandrium_andersonii.AAC.1
MRCTAVCRACPRYGQRCGAPPGDQHPVDGGGHRARIKRAMRAKTQVPGQARDYKLGERVDDRRTGGSKDTSGW